LPSIPGITWPGIDTSIQMQYLISRNYQVNNLSTIKFKNGNDEQRKRILISGFKNENILLKINEISNLIKNIPQTPLLPTTHG
jgi:hypothetical protein